jgi:4-hydroxythreonine-4-phosphate dehydrogenase
MNKDDQKLAVDKPIVGIVMGDPAGIGPEITIKAVAHPEIREVCLPIVIGDRRVVSQALDSFGKGAGIKVLKDLFRDSFDPESVNILDTGNVDLKQIAAGQASAAGGRAVFEDIQRAVELARDKKIHGFVAGPHNKYSVNLAGVHFAGYPPLVAKLTGSRYAFNMLTAGAIRIVGATLHVALKDVSKLTPDLVQATIQAAGRRSKLNSQPPHRGCGLNPHCGEGLGGRRRSSNPIEGACKAGFESSVLFPRTFCGPPKRRNTTPMWP